MKKLIGLSALSGLLLVAPARAERIRGVITKVDPARHEITVQGRGRKVRRVTLTFRLAKDLRVKVDRKTVQPDRLNEGDRVLVRYEERNRKRIADFIRVRGAARVRNRSKMVIVGNVKRVAPRQGEMTILGRRRGQRGRRTEITVQVPKGVSIQRQGKPLRLDQLKPGARVRVQEVKRNGKWLVKSVEVVDAKAVIHGMRKGLQIADTILRFLEP
jgi:hypothetical protein